MAAKMPTVVVQTPDGSRVVMTDANRAAHERSGEPRERELRRLGGHKICNDDRGNHGVERMLESQELRGDERETRGHRGTER